MPILTKFHMHAIFDEFLFIVYFMQEKIMVNIIFMITNIFFLFKNYQQKKKKI